MGRAASAFTQAGDILKAATDLFFERGYAQVGVDEIGVAAGLSGPSIYRRFKAKSDILSALFDQSLDRLLKSTVYPETADPQADLVRLIRAYADFALSNTKLVSIWTREVHSLTNDDAARHLRRHHDYIYTWVDALQRYYPELTVKEAEVAANAAIGSLNSVATWPTPPANKVQIADTFATFVGGGLDRICRGAQDDGAPVVGFVLRADANRTVGGGQSRSTEGHSA